MRLPAILDRRPSFPLLAAAVLCLAAFNLTLRQHVLPVQQWDESLYAMTAWEMLQSGDWIGTTYLGQLDYYNSKPPLNVWLIVLSFKAFGVNMIALRLPSLVAGFGTIALVVFWCRRRFGDSTALLAGLVISTMFAFFFIHAARRANTDAINTLLIVLIVISLWGARQRPWRLAWLGPLLAGVFLLRGMAILLPLAIIAIDEVATFGFKRRGRWAPTVAAFVLFAMPVGAWVLARWQLDGWRFLSQLFWYDFVARTVRPIENHPGSVFFYLDVFQQRHYDWLAAVVAGFLLYPVSRATFKAALSGEDRRRLPARLLLVWAAAALLIPTLVRTKMAWYLHPFYPVFAMGAGVVLAQGLRQAAESTRGWRSWRARALVGLIVLAAAVAEGRIIWYAFQRQSVSASAQGVLLAERERLRGQVVWRRLLDRSEIFVLHALVGARHELAPDAGWFLREARVGDFYLTRRRHDDPRLTLVRTQAEYRLYQKVR